MAADSTTLRDETQPPLESFLRAYAEVAGGLWEEVEPQVYDLMLPVGDGPDVVRVAFDPEALPEHPGAQLASFGTPLIDRLLDDAVARGRSAELSYVGLNLSTSGVTARPPRTLKLAEGRELRFGRVRALSFPQDVFWFEATFVSDQKEQDIIPVGVDAHYLRQVRHLDRLLDHAATVGHAVGVASRGTSRWAGLGLQGRARACVADGRGAGQRAGARADRARRPPGRTHGALLFRLAHGIR